MDKINWAIIGFGRAGKKIYNILLDREDSVVKSICDIDKSKLKTAKFGVSCYTSVRELLDTEDFDIIALCTPSYTHYELAKLAISRGVRNILIEKPPTLKSSQLIDLINLSEKHQSNIFVVLQYRYNPLILSLKELITNKKLGDVIFTNLIISWPRDKDYYLKSSWRGRKHLEGGLFFNQLFHHIDILIQLFGLPKNIFVYDKKRKYSFIETSDTVVVFFDFGSKGIASLLGTVAGAPNEKIEVLQIVTDRYNILLSGERLMNGITLPSELVAIEEKNQKNSDLMLYNKLFDDIYKDMKGEEVSLVRLSTLIKTVKVAENLLGVKENEDNRS